MTAALLWGFENGQLDGAALSRPSASRRFDSEPYLAQSSDDVLECAGSAYSYSANPLVLDEAMKAGLRSIALVGMGCQASINGAARTRGLGRIASRISLTIGLFCSKTFTYEGQADVLRRHGVTIDEVMKVDIKGRFMAWTQGGRVDIPLKELHPHTRPGCLLCPDFSAEHADLSAGGIGDDGWTLVIVRTQRGEDWLRGMEGDGYIVARPGEDDPEAIRLLRVLSKASRRRWPIPPNTANGSPGVYSD